MSFSLMVRDRRCPQFVVGLLNVDLSRERTVRKCDVCFRCIIRLFVLQFVKCRAFVVS